MHQRPQQILRQLMRQYGSELYSDPRRVEAFLQDLCGGYTREIFVLVHAQEQRIPQDLLTAGRSAGESAHWQRLSQRLQDKLALTAEASDWAVESWALALNIAPARYRYPYLVRILIEGWNRIDLDVLWHIVAGRLWQGKRSFDSIGVQWRQWFQQWENRRRWLAPVLLALIFMSSIFLFQQIPTNVLGLGQGDKANVPAEQERLWSIIASGLEQLYPLPRAVRIGEDPVSVHVQPVENSEVLALLAPPGASVIVDAYTGDGGWMHVSKPLEGWIEQAGVTHTFAPSDGGTAYPVVLAPSIGEISGSALRVRQRPSLNAPILGQLVAGEQVVILASTPEQDWLQIVEPVQGWISGDYVLQVGKAAEIPQR